MYYEKCYFGLRNECIGVRLLASHCVLFGQLYLPWPTPIVSGHLLCTDTLSMSRYISMLNHLWLADTCLTWTRTVICWLSAPGITDSVNKFCVFGRHFIPKSLASLTLPAQIFVLSSGDCNQYFAPRGTRCVRNQGMEVLHRLDRGTLCRGLAV